MEKTNTNTVLTENIKEKKPKTINPIFSILVLCGFIACISIGQLVFAVNLNGLLLVMLITLCGITCAFGYSFNKILDIMVESIKSSLSALFIFILIGALVSSWIFAGSLPTMVSLGIEVIHPSIILPGAFLLCMLTSVIAGTSWGTVGTVGIIIMEIAGTMDINLAAVAGAVISGACFGDKLSPMSDTTNLAAMSNEVPVLTHIRSMLKTTVPTTIICLTFYIVYSISNLGQSTSAQKLNIIQEVLADNFKIGFIALLPIIITLALTFIFRSNALIALGSGIMVAILVGVYWQGNSWTEAFSVLSAGYSHETGNEIVDKLLNRGGIDSMMNILAMSMLVICIGGILSGAGYLNIVTNGLEKLKGKRTLLTASSIATTGVLCMATGDSYMPMIVTSKLFRKVYDLSKIPREYLSRCCEDGATLMVPIIPWSVTAIFFSQTLGVNTIYYIPFAMLCWLNPLVSVAFSVIEGFKAKKSSK